MERAEDRIARYERKVEASTARLAAVSEALRVSSEVACQELRRTEARLRASQDDLTARERELRAVFDGTVDAMFIADDDGLYVDVNVAGTRLLGVDRSSIIGKRLHELFPLRADHAEDWETFKRVGSVSRELVIGSGDATRFFELHGTANVLPGRHMAVLHEVTARRNAEQALCELRRSEATLRESRALLERAQAIGHIGSWTVTGTGADTRIDASAETLRIHGIDPATFDGKAERFGATLGPDAFARFATAFQNMRPDGGVALDARITRGEGFGWIHVEAVAEPATETQPPRLVGTTLDITERRAVEEELRASEARYRRIIETTSEGVWLIDAEGRTQLVNRRMAEILGYAEEEMLGRMPVDFAVGHPPSRRMEKFGAVPARQSEQVECELRKKDGATCWVSMATTPLVDASGSHEGALAMVTDISARREANELRERFAAIVESSADAISSYTLDGTCLSWNRGAELLSGYSASEIIGRRLPAMAPQGELKALLARVVQGERVQQVQTIRKRKDGSLIEISLSLSPMHAPDGSIVGVASIARDISERRRAERAETLLRKAEEDLRQAQKLDALGQLAGGVAHDFNNLLSVMLGYTSILMEDLPESDPARADIGEVHEAGLRASELTKQLLAFSRRQVLQPRIVDVDTVIGHFEKMLRRTLGEDIELVLTHAGEHLTVNADPGQLEQVLLNLAVNARDAMPGGGRLTIETSHVELTPGDTQRMDVDPGKYVSLTVTDTGTGMDEAVREHIFEPFFTTKEVGKGTGLGLSTVFGIIKQSSGHISVTSAPGKGTSFQVLLPASDCSPEMLGSGRTSCAVPSHFDETVLLVEDEDQVRALARNILRRAGYRVLEAANAGEALLIAEQHEGRLDIMITDVVMPRMGGHQLATRLRGVRPEMKVLYISGYADDTMLQHGVATGKLEFLAKPFTPASLTQKVRELLEESPASKRRRAPQNT